MCQTLRDIEIICVNDGSADRTLSILEGLSLTDERIRVINTPNFGVVHARETGISEAKGNYITLIDGDDYFAPDALEKLYEHAIQTNADIVNGIFVKTYPDRQERVLRKEAIQSGEEFIRTCFQDDDFYLHARLFRRELFSKRHLFCPENILYQEDVVMVLSLALVSGIIASCPVETYYYVFRDTSASVTLSEKKYRYALAARKIILDYFEKNGLFETYKHALVVFFMIAVYNTLRYGKEHILSPEDLKILSIKHLFNRNVRKMLKKHLSPSDYWTLFPICLFPQLGNNMVGWVRKFRS
jgi:glycosyltransferase involved in cell wall biosynthesis